jgi:hypothetical protein
MSLVILTKSVECSLFSVEAYRLMAKKFLNIKRGPDAVTASLFRGLEKLSYAYLKNPAIKMIKPGDTVFVNGSLAALKWVIKNKKTKGIKKLVSGPNMVVGPNDAGGILNASEIDLILQPSQWVKDFYVSINPLLREKIQVWPSGVEMPKNKSFRKKTKLIIYYKSCSDDRLLNCIIEELKKKSLEYILINYGKFKQVQYYQFLEEAVGMIYISQSESQGIALQEAWARNVPTLVWNGQVFSSGQYAWQDMHISAPYLSPETGLFFKGREDFGNTLALFLENIPKFLPKKYVEDNLSDYRSAEKFLSLISN